MHIFLKPVFLNMKAVRYTRNFRSLQYLCARKLACHGELNKWHELSLPGSYRLE